MKRFCDEDCNNCSLLKKNNNNKMVTVILNALFEEFGDDVHKIVQDYCPNLTCCSNCRIDDFCHTERCELVASAKKYCATKNKTQHKATNTVYLIIDPDDTIVACDVSIVAAWNSAEEYEGGSTLKLQKLGYKLIKGSYQINKI